MEIFSSTQSRNYNRKSLRLNVLVKLWGKPDIIIGHTLPCNVPSIRTTTIRSKGSQVAIQVPRGTLWRNRNLRRFGAPEQRAAKYEKAPRLWEVLLGTSRNLSACRQVQRCSRNLRFFSVQHGYNENHRWYMKIKPK